MSNSESSTPQHFRCGYIALTGTPNTGKSTLLNALVGEKVSITAPRPQTTRHQILGIANQSDSQLIFVDTPGIHARQDKAIHRYMNRAARSVWADVDLVILVLDATRIGSEDKALIEQVSQQPQAIIALNKCDQIKDEVLMPLLKQLADWSNGCDVVPISALKRKNLEHLLALVKTRLPFADPLFGEDEYTDKSVRFLVAELIREQLFRSLRQELPYATTVQIEHYVDETDITRISASIWVERASQKAIVIGHSGAQLKQIGAKARQAIEKMLQRKVYLQLWVKQREGWSDDERSLQAFGYTPEA